MANKFDTNPLDPEFPAKAAAAQQDGTAYKLAAETQTFPTNVMTEDQTRQFQNEQYQTMFNPPNYQPPAVYHTTQFGEMQRIDRKVDKVGLPENVLVALPYLPWGIGLIAGFIELLIVPKTEPKTRFHAAQGLALNIGILMISFILGIVDNFADWVSIGSGIFGIVMTILSVYWAYKAYKGEPIHIEAVDDLTNWLEEKVKIK